VAVIRSSGRYVVRDHGNERSRMQLFTRAGHFIRKIAIRYIDIVAGLAITQEGKPWPIQDNLDNLCQCGFVRAPR
jgi:tripartite motif-containing protein 2/3